MFGYKSLKEEKFLHIIRYKKDDREDDNFAEGQNQWEGKVRAMKTKITKLDNTVTASIKSVRDDISSIQTQGVDMKK